jgi:outer membrane protein assembly factor BamB
MFSLEKKDHNFLNSMTFTFKIIVITSCMGLISSCSLFKDGDPSKDSYQPLWEYNFDIGYFASIDPIVHKNNVIFSGLDEKKNDFSANSTLEAFDKDNGQLIWKWDGTIDDSYDQFNYIAQNYVHNNVLYISTGVDYAIDLNEGTTRSLDDSKIGGQNFHGVDNMILSSFRSQDDTKEVMKCTSVDSFNWKNLITFNNNDSIEFFLEFFISNNQDENIVLIPLTIGRRDFSPGLIKLLKYDLQGNIILLEDTLDLDYSRNRFIDFPPEQNEDNVFLSLNGMVACINKETFEVLWQKDTNGHSSRSGILYTEDNGLYVNTEFYLYSLNPENGNINWQTDSRGGSRLQYHNGVIYYTAGALLRAVDANSGESLMAIEAPSRADDDGAFFQPVMTVDHENDRIYTASYTHAYCYPTLR